MPWRLIARSCALILVYDVVIAVIGRSNEAVYYFAFIVSFLAYAGVAFLARRSGRTLRTSVAAAMVVVLVDVTIGWPISEVIAPSDDDLGPVLLVAAVTTDLVVSAAVALSGALAAQRYGSRRTA